MTITIPTTPNREPHATHRAFACGVNQRMGWFSIYCICGWSEGSPHPDELDMAMEQHLLKMERS